MRLRDVPVVRVIGPRRLVSIWVDGPDWYETMPGFVMAPPSADAPGSPFTIRFTFGNQRLLHWDSATAVFSVLGDLDSLSAKDCKRMVMHLAKRAVLLRHRLLAHAACVLAPSGQALLLCGGSGSGKSTLAAFLARGSYKLVASDIVMLDSRLKALAGTRHLTLYPHLAQKWLPELLRPAKARTATLQQTPRKITFAPGKIEALGYFVEKNTSPAVTHVFRVQLQEGESSFCCEPVEWQERLQYSVILNEDWATSMWLCPSWHMFFPPLDSPETARQQRELALKLAAVPHFRLRGDPAYCESEIQKLLKENPATGRTKPAGG